MNNIKHRLRTKPPRKRRSNRLIRERSIGIINLDRLSTTSSSSRVRQQLRITAFLQTDKPEDSLFNRLSDSQETVVLQQCSFTIPQALGNVLALYFGEDDAVELFVDYVVLIVNWVLVIGKAGNDGGNSRCRMRRNPAR